METLNLHTALRVLSPPVNPQSFSRIKRGLPRLLNGSNVCAFPDTGAVHNIISADYAKEQSLSVRTKIVNVNEVAQFEMIQSEGPETFRLPDE